MKSRIALLALMAAAGCATTSVTPISRNEVIVSTSADADCGASGAAKVASKMAAVETLRRGFERYRIAGATSDSDVTAITTGPTYSTTSANSYGYGNYAYGTCLLYTSPSPRDQRGSRMPSSA